MSVIHTQSHEGPANVRGKIQSRLFAPALEFILALVLTYFLIPHHTTPIIKSGIEDVRSASRLHGTVEAVVDGDTLMVLIGAKREMVRLIGIDAPELRNRKRLLPPARESAGSKFELSHSGEEARGFLNRVVKMGDEVILEFDRVRFDVYGRFLAYVYLHDGTFLNELVAASGFAAALALPPNTKFRRRLETAAAEAESGRRGLWKDP